MPASRRTSLPSPGCRGARSSRSPRRCPRRPGPPPASHRNRCRAAGGAQVVKPRVCAVLLDGHPPLSQSGGLSRWWSCLWPKTVVALHWAGKFGFGPGTQRAQIVTDVSEATPSGNALSLSDLHAISAVIAHIRISRTPYWPRCRPCSWSSARPSPAPVFHHLKRRRIGPCGEPHVGRNEHPQRGGGPSDKDDQGDHGPPHGANVCAECGPPGNCPTAWPGAMLR